MKIFNQAKILIVDDVTPIHQIIKDTLETEISSECTYATNGQEALELIKLSHYDLLISDIRMPIMDGLELLREVRKIAPLLPVIMITGFGDIKSMREAWKYGAFDFIEKPIQESNLLHIVNLALTNSRRYLSEKVQNEIVVFKIKHQLKKQFYQLCQEKELPPENILNLLITSFIGQTPTY